MGGVDAAGHVTGVHHLVSGGHVAVGYREGYTMGIEANVTATLIPEDIDLPVTMVGSRSRPEPARLCDLYFSSKPCYRLWAQIRTPEFHPRPALSSLSERTNRQVYRAVSIRLTIYWACFLGRKLNGRWNHDH